MSLRVGIDAWNLTGDRRGIGRYVREIVRRWAAWGPHKVQPSLLLPERLAFLARGRYLTELGVDMRVSHRGAKLALDVVWYPWNGVSWLTPTPIVATLHDASLFRRPPENELVREREHRPFLAAAKHARRILTDSEFSKDELIRYLGIDPDRIDVIYLGVDEAFRANGASFRAASPYVLFVGEPEGRKGLPVLIEALTRLPNQLQQSLELLVVGARGEYPMPEVPASLRVRSIGWVADSVLARLYRQAAALIYPSEYEGFGLPIVEAMASGAPVIASDTQSSHEAGGTAALYFPTTDAAALAQKIQVVLTQPELVDSLRLQGFENVKWRTWDRTAELTLSALERSVS
jgi:glycosyltransferase involved in cell wall biosynthesis